MPTKKGWWIAGSAVLLMVLVPAATLAAPVASAGSGAASYGAVFTMTNNASGNAVWAYALGSGGALIPAGHFPTHGHGTGASLADQGALALSAGHQWLFVVNAGSDSISVFQVRAPAASGALLSYAGTVGSHGFDPVSLTTGGARLYVLNAGNATVPGNIAGFAVSSHGRLAFLPGSNEPLSATSPTGPAEIAFDPSGTALVVTEKATSEIDAYPVGASGVAGRPTTTASNGSTPYGFAFTPDGVAVVSDAGPGALSSYSVSAHARVALVSGSVGDNQTAPCWVVIAAGGRVAYTTNADSDSISTYDVARNGTLTLAASVGASTAKTPTDLALSMGPVRALFVHDAGAGEIEEFAIGSHGALSLSYAVAGLPATAVGLAAF